jgi:hypothetical protein
MRWKLDLAAFELTVEYKRGSTQRVADELSRIQTEGLSPVQLDYNAIDEIPCLVVDIPSPTEAALLPPPVTPRVGPLVHVPEPLDRITLD